MKVARVIPPTMYPWLALGLVAGAAGLGWLTQPAAIGERLVRRREPTPTGRALGYAAGWQLGPTVDPIGILTTREQLRLGIGTSVPVYRAGRLPAYRRAPGVVTMAIRTQDVRALAAQAPYRQPGARPGVAITAAQVLRPPTREADR